MDAHVKISRFADKIRCDYNRVEEIIQYYYGETGEIFLKKNLPALNRLRKNKVRTFAAFFPGK
ncbi:hypothetical protein SDC9_205114 [bioreactor metagenome]|uniref:Uncharacterized protein n=1 Tax=bioreactor metagenome TaxID=1076179 RepID=A0A645J2L5_9ZZZZ